MVLRENAGEQLDSMRLVDKLLDGSRIVDHLLQVSPEMRPFIKESLEERIDYMGATATSSEMAMLKEALVRFSNL